MSTPTAIRNPFQVIRDMSRSIPNVADQDLILQLMTLDDWVHIYRLSAAAASIELPTRPALYEELLQNGMATLAKSLAYRMANELYGSDAGAQLHDQNDFIFVTMAHLEQGIVESYIPTLTMISELG